MDIDIEASKLAQLLADHDAGALWSVDGAEELAEMLDFPCDGAALADGIRRLGRPLRVFGVTAQSPTRLEDISELAEGGLVLTLAFAGPSGDGGQWLILQDTSAQEVLRTTASG